MNDDLVASIARELQLVPLSAADAPLLRPAVAAHNERIALVSRTLLRMEDHPGTFDAWCRTFASVKAP